MNTLHSILETNKKILISNIGFLIQKTNFLLEKSQMILGRYGANIVQGLTVNKPKILQIITRTFEVCTYENIYVQFH